MAAFDGFAWPLALAFRSQLSVRCRTGSVDLVPRFHCKSFRFSVLIVRFGTLEGFLEHLRVMIETKGYVDPAKWLTVSRRPVYCLHDQNSCE
jgi:hypothetical protein